MTLHGRKLEKSLRQGWILVLFLCLKEGDVSMDHIELIEEVREELRQVVNQRCDDMIRMYQNGEPYNRSEIRSRECRLRSTSPSMLKGKRPVSVTFASGETVETPT